MEGKHWIVDCYMRFPKVAEDRYGAKQDLDRVEEDVSAKGSRNEITQADLLCIETNPAWSYRNWWAPLSHLLEGCRVRIPQDIGVRDSKQELVEYFRKRLSNVRVTSVLLRFKLADEFAVLSDPVIGERCQLGTWAFWTGQMMLWPLDRATIGSWVMS